MKRVLKRDFKKRGKSKSIAKKDFLKAWQLFHKNENKNKPISNLKKISIKNKTNINFLIKRICNILN